MKGGRRRLLFALGGGLLLLNLVGLYFQDRDDVNGLLSVLLLEGGLYLAAVFCLAGLAEGKRVLPFILLVAVLLRIGPLLFPPYLSSDIYRYIWDGRVQRAGINPYRYIPADEALAGLRDAAIYPNINRVDYARTIYPPVAELIFYGVTRISEQLTVMKLAMLAFEAATVFLIVLLLRRGGAPPERVLIYAWHPLAVWEISGSGHIDAALCLFLTLALLARFRNAPAAAGLALAAGALVKLFPALLAPSLYRRWDWRLPASFAALVVLMYLPYLSAGWHVLGFLPSYFVEERFSSGSGFYFVDLFDYLAGPSAPPVGIYIGVGAATLIATGSRPALAALYRDIRICGRRLAVIPAPLHLCDAPSRLVFPLASANSLSGSLLAGADTDLGQLHPLRNARPSTAGAGPGGQLSVIWTIPACCRDLAMRSSREVAWPRWPPGRGRTA